MFDCKAPCNLEKLHGARKLLLLHFYSDFVLADWSTDEKHCTCVVVSMTTTYWHPPLCDRCLFFTCRWDIRAGRMWVRDMIHGWQKCGECYRLGTSPATFWKVERVSIRKKDAGAGGKKKERKKALWTRAIRSSNRYHDNGRVEPESATLLGGVLVIVIIGTTALAV